jgi:vancomycin resistance protein YoaR
MLGDASHVKIGGRTFELGARKTALVLAIAVAAGVSIGVLLVPRVPSPGDEKEPAPAVTLLGEPLALGDEAPKLALERVRRHAAGRIKLDLGGQVREIQLARLGAEIDKVRLSQLVRDVRDATSPLRLARRRNKLQGNVELPVPIVLGSEPATEALLRIKDEVDRAPVDARLDLEKRSLIREIDGRLLDVDATLAAMRAAVARGESTVAAVFEHRKPKRVASELGSVEFDSVLGWFETKYNRAERYAARTFNLRLAASKLDGYVLLPGETFAFNDVVGPRDEANGYKVAPVIAEGELVDGIGGGTCQISGTLHGAVFFAGLDIVERYPHTRPSGYIKMGLDATVVYPTIDFRVKNPFPFPIVLHQTVKNGVVRAEVLGPKRTRTVTLIRKIDSAIPYEEVERQDPKLPSGMRVLSQRGVAGFKLHRYRIVREGEHAVRERWNDLYPPTTQIIRVGTGDMPADSVTAEDDIHPEYVADELLTMTQGIDPGTDGESSAADMRETREPGTYGEARWTQKAGMPFYETKNQDEKKREGDEAPRDKPKAEKKTEKKTEKKKEG